MDPNEIILETAVETMMLKKIILIAPLKNQYGVLDYFTQKLCEALNRQGVQASIIVTDHNNPKKFLDQIFKENPQCTLSFNGILPDAEGRFLCDLIRIPHIAYLVDSPNHFFPLVHSKNNIITCIDQDFCQTFQNLKFPNVLFLPHAVNKELAPLDKPEHLYDVVMFNSFIDFEKIRESWLKNLDPNVICVLDKAAEMALLDPNISYMQAFFQSMESCIKSGHPVDPSKLDYIDLLDQLEAYIGGKSHISLLKSIKNAQVHIFGTKEGQNEWKKYFKTGHKNIHIHDVVSFEEALEIMKRSKIVLNAVPKIKQGLHERLLSGMACGAAVLSLETPYLRSIFKDKENILFYSNQGLTKVNHIIDSYLSDESLRKKLAQKGREIVMQAHTWDHRAKSLISDVSALLRTNF